MTTTKAQACSTAGCTNQAAFATRAKPAWCVDCIDMFVRDGGLESAEPFTGPHTWWLTTCRKCGVQAHYRLDYIRQKNAAGEKTCRACFWRVWAAEQRSQPWKAFERTMLDLLREHTPEQILNASPTPEVQAFLESGWWPLERIVTHLDEHGFDLIVNTVDVNDSSDPVVGRCRACKKISAKRVADFGWKCACSRNTRSSNPASPRTGRVLLVESNTPASDWWDHERNDEAIFRTVTVRSTRRCHWRCPECGLRFQAKVNDMTTDLSCPDCASRRHDEWQEQYELWKVTPVAQIPELAEAWADNVDAREVMVADSWPLRRFRCPEGHPPRLAPLTFLTSGCPHCRGARTAKNKKWLADTLPEIASQWHPTRNGSHTPQTVVWDSQREVWWRADCCGFEWKDSVRNRDKYRRLRCPQCNTTLGSLGWHDPGLAAEWSGVGRIQ